MVELFEQFLDSRIWRYEQWENTFVSMADFNIVIEVNFSKELHAHENWAVSQSPAIVVTF